MTLTPDLQALLGDVEHHQSDHHHVAECCAICGHSWPCPTAQLAAAVREMAKDGERLDWLDKQSRVIVRFAPDKLIVIDEEVEPGCTRVSLTFDEATFESGTLRAAIDAAITAEASGE